MSPLQISQSAPEIETDSARRLTTKSIKLIHAAHAKATQAIEQHIAPGYEAVIYMQYTYSHSRIRDVQSMGTTSVMGPKLINLLLIDLRRFTLKQYIYTKRENTYLLLITTRSSIHFIVLLKICCVKQ